ncbi:MAG: SUMF1/EgtB/PvdO family nonheme iron enzyme [Minicystis sp.]
MRERLVLFIVLVAAAVLAAVLVLARPHPLPKEPPAPPPDPAPAIIASIAPPPTASASAAPTPAPPPPYVHLDPDSERACGPGMVLVDGTYCPYVGHTCLRFLIEERDVCQRYAPEVLCEGNLQHRRFCIDLFEYPNLEGVVPAVMVNYHDAKRACAVEGKRLCKVPEWEFACEGTEMWPYPYGVERDPKACNIDQNIQLPEFNAFSDPWKISAEVERLDLRVPSGTFARCISPFGVRDLTGNVDEWVENDNGKLDDKPYRSSLKGGYWGPIRARCRPMTSSHNEWFSFYQVGFRCCKDALDGGKSVVPAAQGVRIPRVQRLTPPPRETP